LKLNHIKMEVWGLGPQPPEALAFSLGSYAFFDSG